MLREQKRTVDRSVRQLEQERVKLKGQEGKLIADMKKHAKANELKSVKIMAKDLIRIRKHQEKFLNLQAQLRAVSLQMQTMVSTQAFAESMKSATMSMRRMNAQMRLPVLQKIMMEFQKQSEMMGMSQELMGDAIDDALGEEDEEEETDNVVNQILDEIGISMSEQMPDVNHGKMRTQEVATKDRVLEDRLNGLGKD